MIILWVKRWDSNMRGLIALVFVHQVSPQAGVVNYDRLPHGLWLVAAIVGGQKKQWTAVVA